MFTSDRRMADRLAAIRAARRNDERTAVRRARPLSLEPDAVRAAVRVLERLGAVPFAWSRRRPARRARRGPPSRRPSSASRAVRPSPAVAPARRRRGDPPRALAAAARSTSRSCASRASSRRLRRPSDGQRRSSAGRRARASDVHLIPDETASCTFGSRIDGVVQEHRVLPAGGSVGVVSRSKCSRGSTSQSVAGRRTAASRSARRRPRDRRPAHRPADGHGEGVVLRLLRRATPPRRLPTSASQRDADGARAHRRPCSSAPCS